MQRPHGRHLRSSASSAVPFSSSSAALSDCRMREAVDRIEALIHEEAAQHRRAVRCAAGGAVARRILAGRGDLGRHHHRLLCAAWHAAGGGDRRAGRRRACWRARLTRVGVPCRLVTDEPCRATCAAALRGTDVPLDVVPLGGAVDDTVALWRRLGVTPCAVDRALRAQCRWRAAQHARRGHQRLHHAARRAVPGRAVAAHRDRRRRQRDRHGIAARVADRRARRAWRERSPAPRRPII